MSSATSNMIGEVSNTAGLVALGVQTVWGLAAGYKSIGSPHATLKETLEALRNIKTRLDAVTSNQRQKIEAAAAMRKCRSLTDIDSELQNLWDLHDELCLKYEQSSHLQRHFSGQLRSMINNLEVDVRALLTDIWTTTRAKNFSPPSLPPSLPAEGQSNSMDITPAGRAATPLRSVVNRESIEMNAV